MKKRCRVDSQRAVKQLEATAAEGNPAVQMVLPMAEMMCRLHKGVSELIRQAEVQLMGLLMEAEVQERMGERSHRQTNRTANVGASERGYIAWCWGRSRRSKRPRVRTKKIKK